MRTVVEPFSQRVLSSFIEYIWDLHIVRDHAKGLHSGRAFSVLSVRVQAVRMKLRFCLGARLFGLSSDKEMRSESVSDLLIFIAVSYHFSISSDDTSI